MFQRKQCNEKEILSYEQLIIELQQLAIEDYNAINFMSSNDLCMIEHISELIEAGGELMSYIS